jgi:hypothetical protein
MSRASRALMLASVLSTNAFAFSSFPHPSHGGGLEAVAQIANSIVYEINQEIAYIQGASHAEPIDGCEFCDNGPVLTLNENDADVVQHLLRISANSNQIGATALNAANQPGPNQPMLVQYACQLTNSTLSDIPAARATIFWEPRGVARPQTFDATAQKLLRMKSLLPGCF